MCAFSNFKIEIVSSKLLPIYMGTG